MFKKRNKLAVDSVQDRRKKVDISSGEKSTDCVVPPIRKRRNLGQEIKSSSGEYKVSSKVANGGTNKKGQPVESNKNTTEEVLNAERNKLREEVKKRRLSEDDDLVKFVKGSKSEKELKQILQPANVKTTVLVDYQPDICKDYKQTGYCGYGDSCKFLHSRDDFKAGWNLNQEWKITSDQEYDDDKENNKDISKLHLNSIPFKCVICKDSYKSPIVTSCKHYFCGSCFRKRITKDSTCFICGKDTHGTAKVATDLNQYLRDKEI